MRLDHDARQGDRARVAPTPEHWRSDSYGSAGTDGNDVLVQHFDAASPTGCWIRDKFCQQGADGNECTDYSSMCQQPYVPLDLRWRSSSALQLNAISFGNYITEGVAGTVAFDDVVVATRRIGCVHPAG